MDTEPQRELWCMTVSAVRSNDGTIYSFFKTGYVLATNADEASEKAHAFLREHFPLDHGWTQPCVVVGHILDNDLLNDARVKTIQDCMLDNREEASMQAAYAQDLRTQLDEAAALRERQVHEVNRINQNHGEQLQRLNNQHALTIVAASREQARLSSRIDELEQQIHTLTTELEEQRLLVRNNQARREQVEADHGDLLRQNGQLRTQLAQQEANVRALQSVLSLSDPCIHVQIQQAREASARGEGINLAEFDQRLKDGQIQWATGEMPHASD